MKMAEGSKPVRVEVQQDHDSEGSCEKSGPLQSMVQKKIMDLDLDYGEECFTKKVQHYKIIEVKDPFHFLMVKETVEKKVQLFSRLSIFAKLQEEMAREEKKEKVPVHLEKYKLYLALHKGTGEWHRVRLLRRIKKAEEILLVYFVDYPLREVGKIPVTSLRDLPDEFVGYPVVPVYRGYLYDVTPRLRDYEWGKNVVEWFLRAMKEGSVWVGLQMAWRETWVEHGPDQMIDVGVVLFEDRDYVERSMSLNYRLVKLDHGKGIGIGATHFSNLFFKEGEPMFGLEHIPAFPNIDWGSGKLPVFVGNRWPQVAIRRVIGPHCIYVTLMAKYKEYLAMQWTIEEIFKAGLPKINWNYLAIGLGCLVAFKNFKTEKVDVYRSVVVEVIGPNIVEVILVDVGEIRTVPISTLYALPKRVKLIPAFVHRVHLNTIGPQPPNQYLNFLKWDEEMEEGFKQLVGEIGCGVNGGKDGPAWFAVRSDLPDVDDVINLREVCQDLVFDKGDKQWIGMSKTEGHLQNYENQVMIKNHLHSFGVDLLVLGRKVKVRGELEEEEEEELKWGFESLAEIVAGDEKRFEVDFVGKKKDKKGYYDGLLERKERN